MNNMIKPYLAISYTGMQESSYRQANRMLAWAMSKGYNPFSPITHSHPVTEFGVPQDWEFWEQVDTEWIQACDELWVIIPEEGLDRIHNSTGVQAEIKLAEKFDMPIKVFKEKNHSFTQVEAEIRKPQEVQ